MSGRSGGAGRRKLSRLREDSAFRLALILGVTGVVFSFLLAAWSWNRAELGAESALAARGNLFVESANSAVASVVERLV
ncbi:MAG TPA: hypothetical protein EYP73_01135, partial [Acidimicrobiia bacterium]|nr:hypothetical protein [Acidimicrobiia bacterium]